MTDIMMRPGAMNCMYSKPPICPTRRPIRLPKITKYRIAVTAEGTRVWPQMRTMRLYSRIMMVTKPVQRAAASDGSVGAVSSAVPSATGPPLLNKPHEYFLEAIDLVTHRHHLKTLGRQL